jgi:CRISPR-associated endonuclease Cas2
LPGGSWHLLAYDVCCPKRLQRVCKLLQKRALHTQLSLFLLNLPRTQLQDCVEAVAAVLKAEDDLRLYGIDAPELLWQIGAPRQPGLIKAQRSSAKSNDKPTPWQLLRGRFMTSEQVVQGKAKGGDS